VAVNGRQFFGFYSPWKDDTTKPTAVCALGARNLGLCGNAWAPAGTTNEGEFRRAFEAAWGIDPKDANDRDLLPLEHIYGMTVAAEL
jgi:hypothetical protein